MAAEAGGEYFSGNFRLIRRRGRLPGRIPALLSLPLTLLGVEIYASSREQTFLI
jgi:hypothetical protein